MREGVKLKGHEEKRWEKVDKCPCLLWRPGLMGIPPHPVHEAGRCPYGHRVVECPQPLAAGASGKDEGEGEGEVV